MIEIIKNNLIVSCQALSDEPLHSSFVMGKMALASKEGGAIAIRSQGVNDIIEIKKVTNLPIIGIIKRQYPDSEVYITPTKKEIDELLTTNCEMIAIDATSRVRPNNENLKDLIDYIKSKNVLVMADISNYEEALLISKYNVDCISTTLSGYTSYTKFSDCPDFDLLEKLCTTIDIPIIAEGRINTPNDLKIAFEKGAYSVVVGSSITRPQVITKKFIDKLPK